MVAEQLILIVEDDEANRAVLSEILIDGGYRVQAVSSAGEARDAVALERPSLLVLDGSPADDQPIAHALAAKIPAIVVSANSHIERVAEALGAREWLRKPFDMDVLLEVVHRNAR